MYIIVLFVSQSGITYMYLNEDVYINYLEQGLTLVDLKE